MCDHILLHHNSVDTDVETCEFNVVDTNTTLNFDSSIPAVFDSPKRTPKRTSENLPQHGEPRLYMSNDFYINSLLASNSYSCSYRDEEEKQNSLKVLGKPRCWTDSIINSDGEAESSEKGDSDGWTMLTPIRNLAQNSSTKKLPITLETLEDSNEVGYNDKFTLVDMFKNLCIAAKRVVLRGGILLYQPVSNLIQRMTKRNFSLIELRQILYICPEIVSVRWIRVNSAIKKLYPKEYSAFTSDTIFDLKISLKVNDSHCTSSTDFNKALDIFTNAINRYDEQSMHNGRKNKPDQTMDTSTIVNDGLDNETRQLNYPLGELPEKPTPNRGKLLEVLKTPTKFRNSDTCGRDTDHDDHSPSRLSSSSRLSSLRATFKLKCDHGLFTEETGRSHANIGTNTPSRLMFETPKRGVMQLTGSQTPNDKFPLGSPVSNVQLDLLDTPGMKRIKLAALQREMANKDVGDNIIFQLDTRWLVELIYEMIVNEKMSHVISVSSLYEFIINKCHATVNLTRLNKILEQLQTKYPNIFILSTSTLDGSNTLTLSDKCITNPKILDDILQSF